MAKNILANKQERKMKEPKLNKIQKASSKLSQEWKRQSRELLLSANIVQDFEKAVIWCGKGGNVVRSLPRDSVGAFAKYLWENKKRIDTGEYNLSKLPSFGGKKPISWASKIIHIMNPQQYPIIYDGKNKKTLNIRNVDDYMKKVKERREETKTMHEETLFADDSDLWASSL